jgi:hypothetical protein
MLNVFFDLIGSLRTGPSQKKLSTFSLCHGLSKQRQMPGRHVIQVSLHLVSQYLPVYVALAETYLPPEATPPDGQKLQEQFLYLIGMRCAKP